MVEGRETFGSVPLHRSLHITCEVERGGEYAILICTGHIEQRPAWEAEANPRDYAPTLFCASACALVRRVRLQVPDRKRSRKAGRRPTVRACLTIVAVLRATAFISLVIGVQLAGAVVLSWPTLVVWVRPQAIHT